MKIFQGKLTYDFCVSSLSWESHTSVYGLRSMAVYALHSDKTPQLVRKTISDKRNAPGSWAMRYAGA